MLHHYSLKGIPMVLLQIQPDVPFWTHPEFIGIIVTILLLLIVVYYIFRISARLKRMNISSQPDNQIGDKRLEGYEKILGRLYDLLGYYTYVGNWTDLSPMEVIGLKKELDKEMAIYGPLFSGEVTEKYNGFIKLCFISSSGWEHDVKIKSMFELRQEHQKGWKDEWAGYFDPKNVADAVMLKGKFNDLVEAFKSHLPHP